MNIIERLPQSDKEMLYHYLNDYSDSDSCAMPFENIDHFLRFWGPAKEPFYRAFGEQFILRKKVYLEKPMDELADEMYSIICCGDQKVKDFCRIYRYTVQNRLPSYENEHLRDQLLKFIENWEMLVDNVYDGPAISIPGHATKDGRPLMINHGCKAVKMLGKIANVLECEEGYEEFRQAHSQVLNQKKIQGQLCLSIHPMDYITMSDNDCGWTSCMSWMEEPGDYRLGTIEMMNSDCVVVAYVEASEQLYVGHGRYWNNKRWRQLYVVDHNVILGNRQYPYESDIVQGVAIRWLRELMTAMPGYGPYCETAVNLRNKCWNTIGEKKIKFYFETAYMYNDIYDYRLAYVADAKMEDDSVYEVNISGPAVCTKCGDIIEYETVEAHRVQCRACDGHWRCDCCGDWHSEYDDAYTVDDEYLYCDWCYHHELEACDICGERSRSDRHVFLQIIDTDNEEIINDFNYNYHVTLCSCCDSPEEYEPLYGKMYQVTDAWGHTRDAFNIYEITEKGFKAGDWSSDVTEYIKSVRDAKSDEERLRRIREIAL